MRVMGVNVVVVLVVFGLALAGLLYGERYYEVRTVDRPLESLLNSHPLADGYHVDKANHEIIVDARWDPDASKDVADLVQEVSRIGAGGYRTIVVRDKRSPELEKSLYDIHLSIRQALATGDYVNMREQISETAAAQGLDDATVWVGDHSVFLQLKKGEAFLYEQFDSASQGGTEVADKGPMAPEVRFEPA